MPTGYRVDVGKRSAQCNGPLPCKKSPIEKGSFRVGVWVEIMGNGSFKYKHFGCLTPKVVHNMKEAFENVEELDGWEEIPDEFQEKLRKTWELGHVPPEDVTECLRKPEGEDDEATETPKKKTKKAKREDDSDEKPQKARKSKKVKAEEDVEDEKPQKAKRGKKVKVEEDEDEEEEVMPKPKARGSKKAAKEEPDVEAEPKPKKGAKRGKAAKEESPEVEVSEEDEKPAKKAKTAKGGQKTRRGTRKSKNAADGDDE